MSVSNPLLVNMPILIMIKMPSITMGLGVAGRVYNVYSSHCLFSSISLLMKIIYVSSEIQRKILRLLFLLHITIKQPAVRAIAHEARSPEVPRSDTSLSGLQGPSVSPERNARDGPQAGWVTRVPMEVKIHMVGSCWPQP